jgi:septum formation protein
MPAAEVAEYLSSLKSEAYPEPLGANDILLTADTVVIACNRILGKPADRAEAIEVITMLSGRDHEVVTGVTLRSPECVKSFSVVSKVQFRALAQEEIEYYVDTYRPYDKAGSYGIQEWIGYVGIEGIEGSFYNVMGLPVQRLYCELNDFI